MTTQEIPPVDDAMRVSREGAAIRLIWRGEMPPDELVRFKNILGDLVDGQGNLTVAIELPDLAVVDLPLLEALLDVEQRLAARSGTLSVTTRTGFWERAAKTIDWRNHA